MTDAADERDAIRDLLALGLNDAVAAAEAADQASAVPLESDSFGRRFRLLEKIGEGGMGVIYRAREENSERIVALKMISPKLVGIDEVRARFQREVRAAAALEHQHILPIYEVNEWGGIPYFSMKFAEGGSLMDHLADFSRASPKELARLLTKVARGIQHAHDRNVVHRDLKPGNVLLDAESEPLIADFGLAQLLLDNPVSDLTNSLIVLGTPGYIAPELAEGESTIAADIYGLGAIFYHLLTGKRPFDGFGSLQSLAQAAAGPPIRARRLRPEIPRAFETICDCCLQPDPSARYPSAEAFAAEVERVSAGRFRRALTPARKRAWRPFFVFISGLVAVLIAGSLWLNFHRSHSPPAQSQRKFEAKYFADRARETLDREHSEPNLRSAEQLMRRALALDPASAAFHAELSRVLSKIYWHILPDEDVEREARTEAEAALKLDPGLAISHLAMAEYHFRCRRDYPAALHSVEKAGQLDPRDGTVPAMAALVLKRLNRWDDALKNNRRACELEPSAPRFYDLAVTCDILRRYTEALEAIGRARYLAPDNPTHTLLHAWLLFRAQGDGSGLERIVAVLPFEQQMSPQYFDTVFLWLLWAHRPAEALRLADALPDDYAVRRYDAFLLKPYFVGLARRAAGDEIGATTAFQTTREILEDRARKYPNDARIRGQLGVVYGYLGLSADAVREGEHAVQLLSLAQEPVGGSYVAAQLAEIFALVGEGDKAIAIVRQLLDRPGYLTVHELKLDPRWDKLRSAVDFQRLTVSPRR